MLHGERFHLRRENARLQQQLQEYAGYLSQQMHGEFDFGQIVGEAAALREVLTKVEQVAPTGSTVLLRGETGTGKELVAHAIHINSPRVEKPFVRVNCAALSPGVLESELSGDTPSGSADGIPHVRIRSHRLFGADHPMTFGPVETR